MLVSSASISRTPSCKARVKNSLNDLYFNAFFCSAIDISMPYCALNAEIAVFLINGCSLAAILPTTRES